MAHGKAILDIDSNKVNILKQALYIGVLSLSKLSTPRNANA